MVEQTLDNIEHIKIGIEIAKMIILIIGGAFTYFKFSKESKYKRLSRTPFIHMEVRYYNKEELDEMCYSNPNFSYKFINKKTLFNKPQTFDMYKYKSNDELTNKVTACNSIDIISYNHCAYNTWMTFSKDELETKELFAINSHYSAAIPDNGFYRAGSYFLEREDFLTLNNLYLYITYENSYHEKFVDVFKVTDTHKYTKIGSYQIFKVLKSYIKRSL